MTAEEVLNMVTKVDAGPQTRDIDFYFVTPHGAARSSFLVYLSLVGMWASEGESWARPQDINARLSSLAILKKFKNNGGKYTGLTLDCIMPECPGLNSLSLKVPVIRLVRDPLSLLTSGINYNRLFRFFQEKSFKRTSCAMPSAKEECADYFSSYVPRLSAYESIFRCLKHPDDVRVVDTSETFPEDILATLRRVTDGFSLAPYDPQDQRFYKSYGKVEDLIIDNFNVLNLTSSQGSTATVKVWPDYLSYRLVNWRNIPTRRLARFELEGQAYHAVQLLKRPEELEFAFQPDQHLPGLIEFTKNCLELKETIVRKYAAHKFSKETVIAAIRKTPKLYDTFMKYWETEWSQIEKTSPSHIQKWWKNSLEIVSGPAVKK